MGNGEKFKVEWESDMIKELHILVEMDGKKNKEGRE